MKQLLFVGIFLLAANIGWSQDKKEKKSAFSLGGEAAYSLQKNRYGRGIDFGGSLQQEFLVKRTGITLNLGYLHPDNYPYIEHQAWLMAGARYYITKNIFAGGQFGPGLAVGNDFVGATFNYSPGIGVKFKPIDVSLQYRGMIFSGESFSAIGVRVAVVF